MYIATEELEPLSKVMRSKNFTDDEITAVSYTHLNLLCKVRKEFFSQAHTREYRQEMQELKNL